MKNLRDIQYIVVHCTATPTDTMISSIQRYWREELGWKNPGYHYIIRRDGEIVQLLDETRIANGVKGYNRNCIHISYIGGIDKQGHPVDNRTRHMQEVMFDKLIELQERYPKARILGHCDFPGVKKACPSFDVRQWLADYEPDFGMAA